jgi:ABC-type transporter Mla MlaB component
MLRISITQTAGHAAALHLEGQIAGAWTTELDHTCAQLLADALAVTLDLGDVTLIDRAGVALLASLALRGVELVRCSPFQEEQLRLAAAPLRDTNHCHP